MHGRGRLAVVGAILGIALLFPRAAWAQSEPTLGRDWTARRATETLGKRVRITKFDGTKISGALISLGPSGVVVDRSGSELTVPLADVRRVETVGRAMWTGLIAGGVAGFVFGYWFAEEDYGESKGGAILGGLGAAGGAALGALVDRARGAGNLIYTARSRSSSALLIPVVSRDRAGVAFTLRW